jgi:hypothetical protein
VSAHNARIADPPPAHCTRQRPSRNHWHDVRWNADHGRLATAAGVRACCGWGRASQAETEANSADPRCRGPACARHAILLGDP